MNAQLAALALLLARMELENGQLRAACIDHQACLDDRDAVIVQRDEEIAALKADLEVATAPKLDAKSRKKETVAA